MNGIPIVNILNNNASSGGSDTQTSFNNGMYEVRRPLLSEIDINEDDDQSSLKDIITNEPSHSPYVPPGYIMLDHREDGTKSDYAQGSISSV